MAFPLFNDSEARAALKTGPKTSHIPVIFVTGEENDMVNRLAAEAGAVACLTKPFRLEVLVAAVETALAKAALQAKPKAKNDSDGP